MRVLITWPTTAAIAGFVVAWLRQAACGWSTGHTDLRYFDARRIALRCADCGRITHGWHVSARRTD